MKFFSVILMLVILFFNAFSRINCDYNFNISQQNQEKEVVYISPNEKGIVEILIFKVLQDGAIKEAFYTTSKSKKQTKLSIPKQSKNYLEVMFPGEKVVYKLKLNGKDMSCENPDKTTQDYYLSEDGIAWNKVKTITGVLNNAGVNEGSMVFFSIIDDKNKKVEFYSEPKINGEKMIIEKDNDYSLHSKFKGKRVKVTYSKSLSFMEGGGGAFFIDLVQKVELVQ